MFGPNPPAPRRRATPSARIARPGGLGFSPSHWFGHCTVSVATGTLRRRMGIEGLVRARGPRAGGVAGGPGVTLPRFAGGLDVGGPGDPGTPFQGSRNR